jgi:histidyl-tRNA synthetase
MRMYYQEHFNDPKPLKWFYHGACYRYDRPQAGRYREFWQFGCELIGVGTPLAYAELLALADAVMRDIGLVQREFFVGNVEILKRLVETWVFPEPSLDNRAALMRAIDKQDWPDMMRRLAGCENYSEEKANKFALLLTVTEVLRPEWIKQTIREFSPDNPGLETKLEDTLSFMDRVFRHLADFGVANVKLNLGIARGLDYYTGIVFEMHCPILGAEKQLLGGGGYDLSGVFGAQPTPTLGFGLGFDRTIVALEKQAELAGKKQAFAKEAGPLAYFGALSENATKAVLPVVSHLRSEGVAVDLDLAGRKPGAIAKAAESAGARYLVIVGDRDLEAGKVQAKEMATGTQHEVALSGLAAWLALR